MLCYIRTNINTIRLRLNVTRFGIHICALIMLPCGIGIRPTPHWQLCNFISNTGTMYYQCYYNICTAKAIKILRLVKRNQTMVFNYISIMCFLLLKNIFVLIIWIRLFIFSIHISQIKFI